MVLLHLVPNQTKLVYFLELIESQVYQVFKLFYFLEFQVCLVLTYFPDRNSYDLGLISISLKLLASLNVSYLGLANFKLKFKVSLIKNFIIIEKFN